jgi:hypothetical protein
LKEGKFMEEKIIVNGKFKKLSAITIIVTSAVYYFGGVFLMARTLYALFFFE